MIDRNFEIVDFCFRFTYVATVTRFFASSQKQKLEVEINDRLGFSALQS